MQMNIDRVAPGAKGSFGVPEELKAAGDRFKEQRDREESRPSMDDEPEAPMPRASSDEDAFADEDEGEALRKAVDPLAPLAKLGVVLDDEDFHKVLFKGFVEKDVVIVPAFRTVKALSATFKTLTIKEYDDVDELLAEDARDIRMTNDGFASRRSLWILAFGITKLQGKPLTNVYRGEGAAKEFDAKATAKARRAILADLSHGVINRMIHVHAAMTVAIDTIIQDPEAVYLKKS